MRNTFIEKIQNGTITSVHDLKHVYREIIKKLHPDHSPNDNSHYEFIMVTEQFHQALKKLTEDKKEFNRNYRDLFYSEYLNLEQIDKPFVFNHSINQNRIIDEVKKKSLLYFTKWKPEMVDLYKNANKEYDEIKSEKPTNIYRKNHLIYSLTPILNNILKYQITGQMVYKNQLKHNIVNTYTILNEKKCYSLSKFISFLMGDIESNENT